MSQKIVLASVVVTYKTKDYLDGYLFSLRKELETININNQIVVVDNASNDGTIEMVQTNYPEATLIANQDNLGPAKAFNQGISKVISQAEYIIIANSDIKILPGTIQTMYNYLQQHPEVAGVNGPLLFEDLTLQMMRTHIYTFKKVDFSKIFNLEFIGTTFAMIRSSAFKKIGGYDENYYFYNEDQDWSERAKRAHLKFSYLPDAKVIHYISKGKIQNSSRITRELYWSNLYYFKKFYPKFSWLAYQLLKLDLTQRIYKLQRQLKNVNEPSKKNEIQTAVEDLQISKEKMLTTYHAKQIAKTPFWKELE